MINHNALANRLNAVREDKPIPKSPAPFEVKPPEAAISQTKPVNYKQFLLSEAYKLFNVLATSALYGIGLKSIFSTDWVFMGALGVGFLLNHSLTILLKLLNK